MIVCFDFDNTIIRAAPVHVKAFNMAFKKNGLPKQKSKIITSYFGLVGKVLVKKIFPDLSEKQVNKIIKDHDEIVIKKTCKKAVIIRGVKSALKKLKKKGYKIALVSNSKHKELTAILKAKKLDQNLFDVIIGTEDVKYPKPNPDEILRAIKKLKEKKGYMVGDTIYDIQAGKKAKLKTIAVLTGHQSKKRLAKENPDFIIKSVGKINKVLKTPIL